MPQYQAHTISSFSQQYESVGASCLVYPGKCCLPRLSKWRHSPYSTYFTVSSSRAPPLQRRSRLSQGLHPETANFHLVAPRSNVAVAYPVQSVEGPSATLITKPQAIVLLFSLTILFSIIIVVFCDVRGEIQRRKHSATRAQIHKSPQPTSFSSAMSHSCTSHRVIPPPRFPNNHDQSNLRRNQPAHDTCESGGFLRSDKPYNMIMASERLVVGDVTPTLFDLLQGSILQVEKDINASSPKPAVPLTASPTSIKHQTAETAEESIPPDLDCTEAAVASTQGNTITCPIKSSPKVAAKRVLSPKSVVHQLADFPCSDPGDSMESHENYEVLSSRREPSTKTACSVRSRSCIMADKLSSILRPSASTNFSGDASSRPLPLRRLKTSFGVGDDMDSDEDEDQAALSRFFRKQYTQCSLEQQQLPAAAAARDRMTGGLEGRDSPFVGFCPIEPRPHSSLFFLRSSKRGRLVSMKSSQGAICRPDSHHSFNLPSHHDHATPNIPNSPAFSSSGTIADAGRDQALSINGAASSSSQSPENVFFANHSKRNPAGGVTSVISTLGAEFCSSPLSLRSPSHHSSQLPPPPAATHSSSYDEAAYKKDPRRLRRHPEPYHEKHRHSSSAPMKILREASMDLESLEEVKLSITNPDLEFTELDHMSLQKLNPAPVQSSSSASACSPQDMKIHPSSQLPSVASLGGTTAADKQDGGQDPKNDKLEDPDRSGQAESTTKAMEKLPKLTQAMKSDDGEKNPCESAKPSSRRRSWLSSSLSLRILPQRSPSLKSAALTMSPARLRKSLSIGSRISSADMTSPPLVHLESASPTHHHHYRDREPAARPLIFSLLAQENSTLRGSGAPRHEVNKGSGSSLATLLGLFTRPKSSSSMIPGDQEDKRGRSGSPASEMVSSSSSTFTEGGGPYNFFESGRAHGTTSVASTATHLYSPGPCLDRHSPYLSAPPDEALDLAHTHPTSYPHCHHAQLLWTSRLNSVGSFLDDSPPHSAHSGLVIANPDSTRYSEADDKA
ncbi:hypothetical protein VP01_3071g2 [Puccinia sorghi]|uniref:Uncharacterized protein n=1 Tax=Puccinia sorghi TaxID=27349 RepID=A0A0L6UZP9_9BASI|nr:hypothetical protein VP01_3071g2 [Puccinia sorghi]